MKKFHAFVVKCDYNTMKEIRQIIELGKGNIISYTSSDGEPYIISRKLWLKVMMFKRIMNGKSKKT